MKEVQTFESFNQDLAHSVGGFLKKSPSSTHHNKIIALIKLFNLLAS